MTAIRELPTGLVLKHGGHKPTDHEFCVMEAVAYVAGEEWSDSPQCACPVISAFLRQWNDDLPDDESRTRLLTPLIPLLVGTKSTKEVELVRVMLCIDWVVREFTPTWLELVPSLVDCGKTLRDLKPIQSWEDLDAAILLLRQAQEKSAATRDATSAVAWAAVGDAGRAVAGAAARAAAGAATSAVAWAAARAAAGAAAGAVARAAARAAARDALKPTTLKLQESALRLVDRMIAVK